MKRLLDFLVLPPAISAFEARYLARLNRVWLAFFWSLIPLMMAVAALCHTGVKQAALFTAFVAGGTTLAARVVESPRRVSLVFAFTAMVMGGLLVHFGQGPMQIEMHFSFFALLACLAVFGNPLTIVAAAVTVALHHLVLWQLLPRSVFNYNASVWVVAVHAAFVVVESVAASFIARSFFDNVIGLEKIVTARTSSIRLLLDNAEQGFLQVSRDGRVGNERSRVVDEWLKIGEGTPLLWEAIGQVDTATAEWMVLGWEELWADVLPLELAIEQLPRRMQAGGAIFSLGYRPIRDEQGRLAQMLVIICDVSAQVQRERAEAQQRELVRVFEQVSRDRRGFSTFLHEAEALAARLGAADERPAPEQWRDLHTLKGNCAIYGVTSISDLCHRLEGQVLDDKRGLDAGEREELAAAWRECSARITGLVGDGRADVIEITTREHQSAIEALEARRPTRELMAMLRSWRHEPTERRLAHLADAATRIARRLGKAEVEIAVEHNDLRVDEGLFAPVWSALPHLVRNALDHGLEEGAERTARGKAGPPRLLLRSRVDGDRFLLEVEDNGRGVDWPRVAERARRLSLPHETQAQLTEALFADRLTTRDDASEVSGRGVGLGAVRAACRSAGGRITVHSTAGQGTRFEIAWPASMVLAASTAQAA